MAERYFCQNQRRAAIIRGDDKNPALDINGIDYLEVLDSESPDQSLRQFRLLVRLLQPVPDTLAAPNVRISGGVRVSPIGIQWARAATDPNLVKDRLVSVDEATYLSNLFEPDHLLVVRTDSRGDFSTYTLHLVASPTADEPPEKFDPILSQVDFSFKVECPTPFDCEPEEECPPEILPTPSIDYLAKDYVSFRQLLLDRLATINPDWQERHTPDLNLALVELLAYVGDQLSYWQDSVATEAYLGTARQRASMRRHARLLAYPMHDGCNARTWVHFAVDAGAEGVTLEAPQGFDKPPIRLLTQLPIGEPTLAETELPEIEQTYKPVVFEMRTSVTLHQAHNAIPFHTWGDEECCLPTGAVAASLVDSGLKLAVGALLILEETSSPVTGVAADADPSHRHAVRVVAIEPLSDRVLGVDVLNIRWADEDALPFPLCLSARVDGELHQTSIARGNIALADHGRTTTEPEELRVQQAHRKFRPTLAESNLTFTEAVAKHQSAVRIMQQDPRHALPALHLEGDGQSWTPRRDLLDSDRFASHVVAEPRKDGRVALRFGDNLNGRSPSRDAFKQDPAVPATLNLGVIYRVGNGVAGNIGADVLRHIVGNQEGIVTVRNPLPATGGTQPESLEEVRQYAPQAFRRQERAVTTEDYARVVERHPSVQQAAATRRWTGSWHTMFVTIDRKGGLPVDARFEGEMRSHLERYRLAGHGVEIDAPRFVALDIGMTVCVKAEYFRSDVLLALRQRFSRHPLSDGSRGFFHPDNFTFGQAVYLSDVIAAAMGVAGVQWVDLNPATSTAHHFRRWGQADNGEFDAGKIATERLEIAQLDNDPSQPEKGYLNFVMEGGL